MIDWLDGVLDKAGMGSLLRVGLRFQGNANRAERH